MKTSAALKHYGTQVALASALGISKQAVGRMVKTGRIPELQARRLVELTGGKLKLVPRDYVATATSGRSPA